MKDLENTKTLDPQHRIAMNTQLCVHFFLGDSLDAPSVGFDDEETAQGRARASVVDGKLNLCTPTVDVNLMGDEDIVERPEQWDDYVECVRGLPELLNEVVSVLKSKIERIEYCRDQLSSGDITQNKLGRLTEAAFQKHVKDKLDWEKSQPARPGFFASSPEEEPQMDEKETRLRFFESGHGATLLMQLENDRRNEQNGFYAVSGQWAFEEALGKRMTEDAEARTAYCEALRSAGYKEDLENLSDTELAEFIGGEGFEYLIDREEGGETES